jgi:hypothetical protein
MFSAKENTVKVVWRRRLFAAAAMFFLTCAYQQTDPLAATTGWSFSSS